MLHLVALALFSAPLLPAWPPASAAKECPLFEDFDQAREAQRTALVKDLETLAADCQTGKAFLQRDLTWQVVLTFANEHAEARKTLGWKLDRKTGEWTQPREYKAPRDKDHAEALALMDRRAALLRRHSEGLLELLALHKDSLPKGRFESEVEELLKADPDSEKLRGLLGQVKSVVDGQERWMRRETAKSHEQRAIMSKAWDEARSAVPEAEPAVLEDFEQNLGVPFAGVKQTAGYRVLSSASESEAQDVARLLQALDAWMHPILGTSHSQGRISVYLMNLKQGDKFIDSFPGIEARARLGYKATNGSWLASAERLGAWNGLLKSRLDQVVRMVISYALMDTYGRTDSGNWVEGGVPGWIEQGLGIYLTWKMVGTKLSLQVKEADYSSTGRPDYLANLKDDDANWIALARRMLGSSTKPNFAVSLGKPAMAMEYEDLLLGYALSAFLVEGHDRATLHKILRRCCQRENGVTVLEEELGMPLPRIAQSLTDWLEEIRK